MIAGNMKQPENVEKPPEPAEPEEPTPPADTTPPTVVEVAWYSDWQMTEPLTDERIVHPGDTSYTVVTFSEPVMHTVADDETASPAIFVVLDDREVQYRIKRHGASGEGFLSGDAKPLHDGTDDYLCKYTVLEDYAGSLSMKVTGASEPFTHTASFTIATPTEPEAGVGGILLPDYLIPQGEIVLSENEKALKEADKVTGHNETTPSTATGAGKPVDKISLLEKSNQEIGLTGYDLGILIEIYFEENPGEREYYRSRYWMILEAYRLILQHRLDTKYVEDREELLNLYRQSAQEGRVLGLDNPWH